MTRTRRVRITASPLQLAVALGLLDASVLDAEEEPPQAGAPFAPLGAASRVPRPSRIG